jgi:antitoxin (DNA-binding transcriptional repressor) of toxin-antitoxin stability system
MPVVDIRIAESQLDALIDRACAGEEVVIAVDGNPLVRLMPVSAQEARRKRGSLAEQISIPNAFFEPLPDEELTAWEQ